MQKSIAKPVGIHISLLKINNFHCQQKNWRVYIQRNQTHNPFQFWVTLGWRHQLVQGIHHWVKYRQLKCWNLKYGIHRKPNISYITSYNSHQDLLRKIQSFKAVKFHLKYEIWHPYSRYHRQFSLWTTPELVSLVS